MAECARAPHPDGEHERARHLDSQVRPQKFGVLECVGPVCAGDLFAGRLSCAQIAVLEPALGRNASGIAVAITTAMAIFGRLTLGAFADRIDQRIASALSLISQAAPLALMASSTNRAVLLAASALYGFSVGNIISFPA